MHEYENINDEYMVPRGSNGGSKMRFNEINRIRDKLENDIKVRNSLSKCYKRSYNILHAVSTVSSSIAAIIVTVTLATNSNLTLTIITLIFNALGALLGGFAKMFIERVQKHERLFLLANSALRNINELFSESLKDSHVSDSEFKVITGAYNSYLMACKREKDSYGKNDLVYKEDILKTLNKALNK